ncbi:MAG: hypothetical protein R3F59_04690 [Myxococcota bacterium]
MVRSLALCAVVACTRVPLAAVPVEGGTRATRAAAREELAAFDGWAGPGRVALSSVTFRALGDDHVDGMYRRTTAQVVLDEALSADVVRIALRHELCHALDWQEGLLDAPDAAFDAAGDLLFSPFGADLPYDEDRRGRRSEALAQVCEVGPFGAVARATRCDGEPEVGAALAAFAWERVWRGAPAVPVRPPAPLEATAACCAVDARWDGFGIWPTAEAGRLAVHLDGAETVHLQVLLDSGAPAPGPRAEGLASVREVPPLPAGARARSVAVARRSGGCDRRLSAAQARGERRRGCSTRIRRRPRGWALDGQACLVRPLAGTRLFTADARVWRAWRGWGFGGPTFRDGSPPPALPPAPAPCPCPWFRASQAGHSPEATRDDGFAPDAFPSF